MSEVTRAELERHMPDDWDVVITHSHQRSLDEAALPEVPTRQGISYASGNERSRIPRFASQTTKASVGILRRLLRRERLSPVELEEQRVTQTKVLAGMQRQIGEALGAIEIGDFDTIAEIACRLRDDATSYDFAKLSGLGAALYDTVPNRDIRTARNIAHKLMTYMGKTIGYYLA